MNDLVGFIVALVALRVCFSEFSAGTIAQANTLQISQKADTPKALSFGWQRAQLLGAFFNGVFLLALGMSIFLQSIERFISLQRASLPVSKDGRLSADLLLDRRGKSIFGLDHGLCWTYAQYHQCFLPSW